MKNEAMKLTPAAAFLARTSDLRGLPRPRLTGTSSVADLGAAVEGPDDGFADGG